MHHLACLLAVLLGACQASSPASQPPAESAFASQPVRACAAAGQTIDSAFVVAAARRAIAPASHQDNFRVLSFEAVIAPGPVEEGVLVRLTPTATQLGGGGLAYVDVESGCAIALKHYE